MEIGISRGGRFPRESVLLFALNPQRNVQNQDKKREFDGGYCDFVT